MWIGAKNLGWIRRCVSASALLLCAQFSLLPLLLPPQDSAAAGMSCCRKQTKCCCRKNPGVSQTNGPAFAPKSCFGKCARIALLSVSTIELPAAGQPVPQLQSPHLCRTDAVRVYFHSGLLNSRERPPPASPAT
jgi:hypothetical protein